MLAGPLFAREAVTTPRRPRHYAFRAIYVTSLLILMCTAWLVLAGTQDVRNLGDMARFGSSLFQVLAPLQLTLFMFLSALAVAVSIAQEKDRRTLILLLMTRMTNGELVVGKLLASLLQVGVMLAAAWPVFLMIPLFGGVSFEQVGRVFAVTAVAALATGSLGGLFAFWREKTFQTLSMTALTLVIWLGLCEAAAVLGAERTWLGLPATVWADGLSPLRAVWAATQPAFAGTTGLHDAVVLFVAAGLSFTFVCNLLAIAFVRVWNPSRDVQPRQEETSPSSIWGAEHDLAQEAAEKARAEHVDARRSQRPSRSRPVGTNPVLWRETSTWAYGRKVLVVRAGYLLLFAMTWLTLGWTLDESTARSRRAAAEIVPATAKPLAPFFVVSLVLVNALAVTSITNERDGQTLDLLLVSDLSPKEFVFGKLLGVLWVTREMVALPMVLAGVLWWRGGLDGESLVYLLTGLAVMNVFVAMLGLHCGMTFASSRSAIGISLGIVFFLFLGVVTCLVMMISFSGSFETQFLPFSAFILGGSVGLYATLGVRNPSSAILGSALMLPIATFFAITSFVLRDRELSIFFVISGAYGFTTAAMMLPALFEFDIAMGRTRLAEE